MFNIGDKVSCPMHGAGIVEEIISRPSEDGPADYLVVRVGTPQIKITMPAIPTETSTLRCVISQKEACALLSLIPTLDCFCDSNWSKRYKDNMERLKTGDVTEIARVFKSLGNRSKEKGLSAGERKMFHCSKQILASEISLSLDCSKEEAEQQLLATI